MFYFGIALLTRYSHNDIAVGDVMPPLKTRARQNLSGVLVFWSAGFLAWLGLLERQLLVFFWFGGAFVMAFLRVKYLKRDLTKARLRAVVAVFFTMAVGGFMNSTVLAPYLLSFRSAKSALQKQYALPEVEFHG